MLLESKINGKCIINEAYFGTNPLLNRLDAIFGVVVDRVNENKYGIKQINSMFKISEQNEIEKILEELFGFKKVRFTVAPAANAFTLPYSLDASTGYGNLVKTKRGKYNQPVYIGKHRPDLLVNFGVGLIASGFNARECVAIVLHEIGHNFSKTSKINNFYSNFQTTMMYITVYKQFKAAMLLPKTTLGGEQSAKLKAVANVIYSALATSPAGGWVLDKYRSAIRAGGEQQYEETNITFSAFSAYSELYNLGYRIARTLNDVLTGSAFNVKRTLNMFYIMFDKYNVVRSPVSAGLKMLELGMGYRDEKFSDNFPTAFGYGPEAVAMAAKMNTNLGALGGYSKIADEHVPLLGFLVSLGTAPISILGHLLDPHPSNVTRATDQIRMLRHQLKSKYVPDELKTQVAKDLDMCEEVLKDNKKSFTDVKLNSTFAGTLKSAFEFYTGGDIKELVLKRWSYDYKHLFTTKE